MTTPGQHRIVQTCRCGHFRYTDANNHFTAWLSDANLLVRLLTSHEHVVRERATCDSCSLSQGLKHAQAAAHVYEDWASL